MEIFTEFGDIVKPYKNKEFYVASIPFKRFKTTLNEYVLFKRHISTEGNSNTWYLLKIRKGSYKSTNFGKLPTGMKFNPGDKVILKRIFQPDDFDKVKAYMSKILPYHTMNDYNNEGKQFEIYKVLVEKVYELLIMMGEKK